jgi:hypothetical protein
MMMISSSYPMLCAIPDALSTLTIGEIAETLDPTATPAKGSLDPTHIIIRAVSVKAHKACGFIQNATRRPRYRASTRAEKGVLLLVHHCWNPKNNRGFPIGKPRLNTAFLYV